MTQDSLDKFYTKNEIASECINLIPDLDSYDVIIEPSAGNGAFSKQIKHCIAYDIAPDDDSIIKQDFLALGHIPGAHICFVGNPPFGKRGELAKRFMNHAMNLNAETICFILPTSFSKVSNQNTRRFPKKWKLIVEHPLPKNSFLVNGKEYHVPCTFYIWTKRPSTINLRKERIEQPATFQFLPPSKYHTASFCINGNSGLIRDVSEITNPKAEHYIKENVQGVRELFDSIEFEFFAASGLNNFGWLSRQDILRAYAKATTNIAL
jgi:hypothetical protein